MSLTGNLIGTGIGGNPYNQSCGPNGFVTDFQSRSGSWMNAFGINSCSNGITPTGTWANVPVQGPTQFGGNEGTANANTSCATGFSKVAVTAGAYINTLTFFCDDIPLTTLGQGGGNVNQILSCPPGQVIQSIEGNAGRYLDNIGFTCNYRSNCADPNNTFSPDCAQYAIDNPVGYKQNVKNYCSANFDQNCKN